MLSVAFGMAVGISCIATGVAEPGIANKLIGMSLGIFNFWLALKSFKYQLIDILDKHFNMDVDLD